MISIRKLYDDIWTDIRRYIATGAESAPKVMLLTQGFWATCSFRLCDFICSKTTNIPIIGKVATLTSTAWLKGIQILTGISLPVGCTVGRGLYIAHFGGIIIASQAKIGNNCNIGYQVGIGYGRAKGEFGYPELGDRVFVGPGAKILGPIKIGNDVAIGANAVVTSDIQDRAVAVGIPAKVIGFHGSFEYIFYDGMDTDEDRLKSKLLASKIQQPNTKVDNES